MKQKKSKGFTLLETILVLGIAGVAATLALQEQARNLQTRIADISGAQIAEIGKATNAYMMAYYEDWSSDGSNADDLGSSADGGPRNCNSSDICTITISTLVNNGFLNSWNPNLRNPFRSPYEIVIKRNSGGATGMPILNALIVTEDPYIPKAGGEVSFDLLGRAIQTAGAQAGFSRNIGSCSDTSICGYGGSFTVDSSNYSNVVTQEGQLGYYTGVSAGQGTGSGINDDYLLRDGTLPMTGNLNMDSNDIENVRRINGTPNSGLRMSAVRISDDPADLPAVNAAPEFSTAANVPSTFRGSVTIDDDSPSNGDYIAVFRQNASGSQREFEIGNNARTRFNNNDENAIEVAGGINFGDTSSATTLSNLGRGPESQNIDYSSNDSNFSGSNKYGKTPVMVNDSLSIAGMITNQSSDFRNGGVNIADPQGIDLSTRSSNSEDPFDSARPRGYITIGGRDSGSEVSNLKVNNGALYMDADSDTCAGGGTNCDFTNPERGSISAQDMYIREYLNQNNINSQVPLSKLINNKIYQRTASVTFNNIDTGYAYINTPNCSDTYGENSTATIEPIFPLGNGNQFNEGNSGTGASIEADRFYSSPSYFDEGNGWTIRSAARSIGNQEYYYDFIFYFNIYCFIGLSEENAETMNEYIENPYYRRRQNPWND